ncbi:MAG: aldo/keto reductase [Pikeienuella sp.]
MQNIRFGRTALKVSELCFGTMTFGAETDEAESGKLYAACRDAGINFFDCADVYAGGDSERILGRLIAHERDDVIITTKCGFGQFKGAGRAVIRRSCEESLKRLNIDRIDIYYIHQWDAAAPIEETMRALEDLRASGKVAHLAVSNFAAWQIAKANGISAREGWATFEVMQPMYNLLKRQAEVELLPLAQAENIAVMPYGPAAGGLLSGKYASGGTGRFSTRNDYQRRYGDDYFHDAAARFTALAADKGIHPMTLAVAWSAAHPAITTPIIGARSMEQLPAQLAAADLDMTAELRAEITALSLTPPPATDRLDDVTTTKNA